jgi:hypothetical protein
VRRRLAVSAALAVAAAVPCILPLSQAAGANTGITVMSISSPADNVGQMVVETDSSTPVSALAVELLAGTPLQPVLNVTDFSLTATFGTEEVWTLQDPITPDQLPLGQYTASVTATDTGGDSLAGSDVGVFDYVIETTVTLAVAPASVNYNDQGVTFTGQATEWLPGATATQALGQQQIVIDGPGPDGSGGAVTDTDANGDFTASATVMPGNFQAIISSTATMTGSASEQVQVTAAVDPITLTAHLTSATVKYGQPDSVTGTVQYKPGPAESFQPLAGTTVTLNDFQPGSPQVTVVTGPLGTFTASLPKVTADEDWTVQAGGGPFLDPAAQNLAVNVLLPTALRHVKMVLSTLAALSVQGCLAVTSPGGAGVSPTSTITLQDARGAAGPWKKLATIRPVFSGVSSYCGAGMSVWQTTVTTPLANGYYRLSFAGNSGLQPSVGEVLHRWRHLTRITSFTITPHRIAANGAVTVSGRLWRDTSSWHPYASRKIVIMFTWHRKLYYFLHELRTDSAGYFSGRFALNVTAAWTAQYDGDKTHFASASPAIKIIVSNAAAMPMLRGGGPRVAPVRPAA